MFIYIFYLPLLFFQFFSLIEVIRGRGVSFSSSSSSYSLSSFFFLFPLTISISERINTGEDFNGCVQEIIVEGFLPAIETTHMLIIPHKRWPLIGDILKKLSKLGLW